MPQWGFFLCLLLKIYRNPCICFCCAVQHVTVFHDSALAPLQHTEVDCLVLLPSDPDTIHRLLLHKTRTSTPFPTGRLSAAAPRTDITPTIADCGYRAPLPPRLARKFYRSSFNGLVGRNNASAFFPALQKYCFLHNSLISITAFYSSVNSGALFFRNLLKNNRISRLHSSCKTPSSTST